MNWCDYFYYDESSPSCLMWKNDRVSGKNYSVVHQPANTSAGSLNGEGYWQVKIGNKNYQAHRIIYEIKTGAEIPEGIEVNHVDRDRSNNKIANLTLTTKTENLHNKNMYTNNTSGVTGVRYVEKMVSDKLYSNWIAIWRKDGKHTEKWFSCNKYGYDQAFQLACDYRAKMIAELNEQGAGYTETHGK